MSHFDPVDFSISYINDIPENMLRLISLIRRCTAECSGVPHQSLKSDLSADEFMHQQTEDWDEQVFLSESFDKLSIEIVPNIEWAYPGAPYHFSLLNDRSFDNYGQWVRWLIFDYISVANKYVLSKEGIREKALTLDELIDYV